VELSNEAHFFAEFSQEIITLKNRTQNYGQLFIHTFTINILVMFCTEFCFIFLLLFIKKIISLFTLYNFQNNYLVLGFGDDALNLIGKYFFEVARDTGRE